MSEERKAEQPARPPGVCIPWQEKLKELPEIRGDRELVKREIGRASCRERV